MVVTHRSLSSWEEIRKQIVYCVLRKKKNSNSELIWLKISLETFSRHAKPFLLKGVESTIYQRQEKVWDTQGTSCGQGPYTIDRNADERKARCQEMLPENIDCVMLLCVVCFCSSRNRSCLPIHIEILTLLPPRIYRFNLIKENGWKLILIAKEYQDK